MVSVQDGEKVFLFGGCRGDGTRLEEAFLLDLASPVGVADVRSDEENKGDDIEDEAVQVGAMTCPSCFHGRIVKPPIMSADMNPSLFSFDA